MRSYIRLFLIFMISFVVQLNAVADENSQYPIVIKHALGTTIIEKKPQRIAAIGWANHEVPLALGIVPVGFAKANFGDENGDGLLPWVSASLKDLNAETPVLFDEGDGIDFEAVADTKPDVILAAYSGLSQSDYDMLSQIAPVVAYDKGPWATDWRSMIKLNSAGIGMAKEGEQLITKIEEDIANIVATHPLIKNKNAMFITHLDAQDLSKISFYTANDMRLKFLEDLGMSMPQAVRDASQAGKYSATISAERVDMFNDVDIVITYGGNVLLQALEKNPLLSKMPAVANKSIVLLENNAVGTAANPTPLSISWVLKDYVALLDEAARKSNGD